MSEAKSSETILVATDERVGTITLNRPRPSMD
jgi:enoyl-CoA hydratase/carnithine racemase